MPVTPSEFGIQGFAFPVVEQSGGDCDYPVEDDVRYGVVYGDSTYTGTVVLPHVSRVQSGIQYGSDGTEFTGTLTSSGGGGGGGGGGSGGGSCNNDIAGDTLYANQSVAIDEILDAFQDLLEKAACMSSRNVVQWHKDSRPDLTTGGSKIWYRFVNREFDDNMGPGRHGIRQTVIMEVNLTSRLFTDQAQKDRKIIRAHLNTQFLIENAFYFRFLYMNYLHGVGGKPPMPIMTGYNDKSRQQRRSGTTGIPIGALSIAPMTAAQLPAPDKPRPEQGYLESRIGIAVPCVLRITSNPEPEFVEEND